MTQALESEKLTLKPSQTSPPTDSEIVAYLRRSRKFAETVALVERDALVLDFCAKINLDISEEEWQAAGDNFRLEHKLFSVAATQAWLTKQQITLEDWSEGLKLQLLTEKLKEYLFGANVDNVYLANREKYRRVALSQILVSELEEAEKIVRLLQAENASFSALALEHSKGKQSHENGGFIGICFITELMPEIEMKISQAKEGEVIEPIKTKLGYHIFRVEKWFPHQLSQLTREQILESLFQAWLKQRQNTIKDKVGKTPNLT